jgi:hypothetical protein
MILSGRGNRKEQMPSFIGLGFTYLYHDSDIIELRIIADNGMFGGTTNVYVGVGGLNKAAAALSDFPKSQDDAREFVFGAFGPDWAGGAVRLQLYRKGLAGRVVLQATIEADFNRNGANQSAVVITDFELAALDSFLAELQLIEENLCGNAEMKFLKA